MCATGIKQSLVLYHNSFFWYLHEHRHVHSLKIRQCATHSVDNSTERARERGVGAYWKLQLERGQFLHLLVAKLKIGDDFKNDWWTKNMNRSHPKKNKIKTEKIKCLFTLIGSVNFYDFEWILLSENSKNKIKCYKRFQKHQSITSIKKHKNGILTDWTQSRII